MAHASGISERMSEYKQAAFRPEIKASVTVAPLSCHEGERCRSAVGIGDDPRSVISDHGHVQPVPPKKSLLSIDNQWRASFS